MFLGWDEWSPWSDCINNERVRIRKCLVSHPNSRECQGKDRETLECLPVPILVKAGFDMHHSEDTGTNRILILCVTISLLSILLCCFSIIGTYFYMKKRIPTGINGIPKSPCFDSFPNEYSSLPTRDVRNCIYFLCFFLLLLIFSC